MKPFMNKDFLLSNETAVKLYHEFAANTPIVDYHCHIEAKDIAEDVSFGNITELWLGGDHYKWRYMRSCGVEERYITGDASPKEKFLKWAEVLGSAIGHPLYHWSHLELQRYFGITTPLNRNSAEEIWEVANQKLQSGTMTARSIILDSKVTHLCTTDDPIDSLEYHRIIADDASFDVKVLPAFRPDNAMNIEKEGFLLYIKQLEDVCQCTISTFADLKEAICERMKFFDANGCVLADHGLDILTFEPADEAVIEGIFTRRLQGIMPDKLETEQYRLAFLLFVHKEYAALNWTSQLHFGCKRDNNRKMFERIGPNTGFDCIRSNTSSGALSDLLDALAYEDALPRMVLYSLDPNDNAAIDTIIGCFQDSTAVSKIQHGSAWWFNDHKIGMENHLASLAAAGNLAGFVGMLTDSRSFLSYTRHEYFRRILCNYLGTLVEQGEFPADFETLGEIVRNISYYNAIRYMRFEE